ncbi:MAG TPA: hypothetical protein VGC45_01265 [Gryllotalpicola sp.]
MSAYIGLVVGALILAGVLTPLIRPRHRDSELFGDALVRVRLFRTESPEEPWLYAEIEIDNQNDSPVMVSARARTTSLLTLFFATARTRRTALVRRRRGGAERLDAAGGHGGTRRHSTGQRHGAVELLGAVDGRAVRRFVLPVAEPAPHAVRVTTVVDQVAQRTRIIGMTLRVTRALPTRTRLSPTARPPLPRNEEAGRGRP